MIPSPASHPSARSVPDNAVVLIEIGHPAHVHFFRRAIPRWEALGIRVRIITRNKDITDELMDRFQLKYESLSRPARSKPGLLLELLRRWWGTYRILKKEKVNLAVSIAGITTAVPAWFAGVRNLSFQDTEDARLSNRIAIPFSDRVITPEFYRGDYGNRHERYRGLHELAYLQDFDFGEAERVRARLGLPARYSILRKVANTAVHDWGIQGFGPRELDGLIERLKQYGEVFISSEGDLPPAFRPYRLNIPLEAVHAVLAGARIFVGESPTMAVEASLLGTPSLLLSQRCPALGNMISLQEEGLLINCTRFEELERELDGIEELDRFAEEWRDRARKFREQAVSMTDYVTDLVVRELK